MLKSRTIMKNHFLNTSLVLVASVSMTSLAFAQECIISKVGRNLFLRNDCVTSTPILVPDNGMFEGGSRTLTVVDPEGGVFEGSVIKNIGEKAIVQNVTIRPVLSEACRRIVGVTLDGSNGQIRKVNVVLTDVPASSCIESVGFEVINSTNRLIKNKVPAPTLRDSSATDYDSRGVIVKNLVNVRIENTSVTARPVLTVNRRVGVEATEGAILYALKVNSLNNLGPVGEQKSSGFYLSNTGLKTRVDTSFSKGNDVGIWLSGVTGATINKNLVTNATLDGIALDDAVGLTSTGNSILSNDSSKNRNGIFINSVNGVVLNNTVKQNKITRNRINGIVAGGRLNKIDKNTFDLNTNLPIANTGTNTFSGNKCVPVGGTVAINCGAIAATYPQDTGVAPSL